MTTFFRDNDEYADIHIIPMSVHFVMARVAKEDIDAFDSPIVKMVLHQSWDEAILETGITVRLQPHAVAMTKDELIDIDGAMTRTEIKLFLIEHKIVDADLEKFQKALAIKEELTAAKKRYTEAIEALGAEYHESGSYQDWQCWYEIPNVPYTFEVV